jgi:hypothetical protein
MREKQESIIIFKAACVAGLAVSAIITAGGLFLDLVTPLYDAGAESLLPGAASLALKGLPAWIALFALYGLTTHFLLKQRGQTREIHYILATMISLYSLFVTASFLVGPGDGPILALAGGLPISLVLSFPLGITFRRMIVQEPAHAYARFETVGRSYFAGFNH